MQITKHSEFYCAEAETGEHGEKETRYYPVSAENRARAIDFDSQSNPVRIMGFGVYDYNKSKVYASGLFNSLEAAEAFVKIASCPQQEEMTTPSDQPENAPLAAETAETEQPTPKPKTLASRGKKRPPKPGKRNL